MKKLLLAALLTTLSVPAVAEEVTTGDMVACIQRGGCSKYVLGIKRSLEIYEEVCGTRNQSSQDVLDNYLKYADHAENLKYDKYSGVVTALQSAYPCGKARSHTKSKSKSKSKSSAKAKATKKG